MGLGHPGVAGVFAVRHVAEVYVSKRELVQTLHPHCLVSNVRERLKVSHYVTKTRAQVRKTNQMIKPLKVSTF